MKQGALIPLGDRWAPWKHKVATACSRTWMLNRSLSKPRDTAAVFPWCPGLCHSHSYHNKATWACNTIRMGKNVHAPLTAPRSMRDEAARSGEEAAVCRHAEICASEDFLQSCWQQLDISWPLSLQPTRVLLNSWEKWSDAQELYGEGWSQFMKVLCMSKINQKKKKGINHWTPCWII